MSISIQLNQPKFPGSGQIDPLRVVIDGPVSDDLDPRVIFSALYLSAQYETYSAYVNLPLNSSTAVGGSWQPSRRYKAHPFVYGVFRADSGSLRDVIRPFIYTVGSSDNVGERRQLDSREEFIVSTLSLGNGYYRADYTFVQDRVYTMGGPGTLKLFAIGMGI